ncbi:Kinase, CAMKK [Spironucleus salmonicida]|uniref:Kinase, CAMKK n=1 Tax=Spironucleus salmonicida TaxID=348837 RepID=V6LXT7_9EUKA|nr:Kinase, CAMKK [Spironucleus salmonicida]|eukprot:EST48526.1 Kinase, CAMKK [Spironucleus salmonicida]
MSMNYVLAQSIGRGSYGSVYYAIDRKTKQEVAIKVMNKAILKKQVFFNDSTEDEAQTGLTQVYDEIQFMRDFNHPLLLRLVETIDQDEKIYIVIQLAEGIIATIHQRDLSDDKLPDCISNLLQLENEITPPQILLNLAFHTSIGLLYMHKRHYIHGDIKPANILRTHNGRYILGDFGLSQPFAKGAKYMQIVSPAFSAPESQGLTPQNDVWAYGVVLFQLLFGEHPAVLAAQLWNGEKIAHWGQALTSNQEKFKELLNLKRDEQINKQKHETQLVSSHYDLKLNSDIIHNIYGVLTEITYFCLIDLENRVCMESIYNRLLEFYCRIIAAKYAKYFSKGFFQQLHPICQQLDIMNVDHVEFILQLNSMRFQPHIRQNYQRIFEAYTDIKQIDFSYFKYLYSTPEQTIKQNNKSSKVLIEDSTVEEEMSYNDLMNYTKTSSIQRQISSQSIRTTPKKLGKIIDNNQEPNSPISSFSSTNKLQMTEFQEEEVPVKIDITQQWKKPVGSSLASKIANLPPPKVMTNDSDSDRFLPESKPVEQSQNFKPQFKKPVAQSLASKLASMPPPPALQNDNIQSDSDEMIITKKQDRGQQHLLQQSIPANKRKKPASTSLASSIANLPPPSSAAVEDSDSDIKTLQTKIEDQKQQSDDSDGDLGQPKQTQIQYGKFKKPQSLASSMAAKLAAQPPPVQEEEDSEGPMDIRGAKKKGETVKYAINFDKLNQEEVAPVSVPIQQVDQQQIEIIEDDVFGIETPQNEVINQETKKADLEQRNHFFLKLDLHLVDTDNLSSKQVKSLFKQISYTNDEYKPFKYDHNNDQAKILGLGSFSKDTLSVGRRESEDDDISDDDDDLVTFDDDGDDDFNNTFDQVFNIEEDEEDKGKEISAAAAQSLVNRGKGKFKTLRESVDEEEDIEPQMVPTFKINNILIDEEDEDNLQQSDTFNKSKDDNFGSSLLPFGLQKKDSSDDEQVFKMKFQDSDDEQPLDLTEKSDEAQYIPPNKSVFLLNINKIKEDEKVRLFEEIQDEEFQTQLTQQTTIPLSARHLDVLKEETQDQVILTPKQIVIFFHPLLQLFMEVNQHLTRINSQILVNSDYIFMIQQVQEIIDAYTNNIPLVTVITIEIILDRLEMWKNLVDLTLQDQNQKSSVKQVEQQHLVDPQKTIQFIVDILLVQFQNMFQEIELIYDKSPAFLNTKTGWQVNNPYTLFQLFEQKLKIINSSPSRKYGVSLTINEQPMLSSLDNREEFNIHLYIGLDTAECTPIVGLRHKIDEKTLFIQQSSRAFKLQDTQEQILQFAQIAQIQDNKADGLTNFQPVFMNFLFLNYSLASDYIQINHQKSDLFKYSYINLQRQAILPNFFANCLFELILNSYQNSRPSIIRASLFNADGSFYLVVSDSGNGLSQDQTDKIFSNNTGSLGTGLAYLRMLVGFYNGMINVSSDDQSGTRVIVKIPMVQQNE